MEGSRCGELNRNDDTALLGQRLLEVDKRMHEVQSGDSMTVERRDACHHAPLDQSLDD